MEDSNPSKVPAERLELLYNLSQTFNSSLDLEEVLDTVMDEVISATSAERGFVVLREDSDELDFRAARGIDQSTIADPEFQISRGVVDGVIESGEAVLTSDAQSDERFSSRMSVVNLRLRSILCAPLSMKGQILGAVYVDNSLQAGIFSEADRDLLTAIAASAATAIENARLYQVAVEKGRMERELQLAYRVQSSLIPSEVPEVEGWQFAASWIPAREVAGDFYDYFPLEERKLGLVIGDVADKGIASAMFMANCRSVIRASLLGASSPAQGIRDANRLICADAADGIFLTLFYAQLDFHTGELIYVNAGHNPPLVVRGDSGKIDRLDGTGIALGVLEGFDFAPGIVNIDRSDIVCLYTDGVTETFNPNGEQFGEERLVHLLIKAGDKTLGDILSDLKAELDGFSASDLPFDDVTLLMLKREAAG